MSWYLHWKGQILPTDWPHWLAGEVHTDTNHRVRKPASLRRRPRSRGPHRCESVSRGCPPLCDQAKCPRPLVLRVIQSESHQLPCMSLHVRPRHPPCDAPGSKSFLEGDKEPANPSHKRRGLFRTPSSQSAGLGPVCPRPSPVSTAQPTHRHHLVRARSAARVRADGRPHGASRDRGLKVRQSFTPL